MCACVCVCVCVRVCQKSPRREPTARPTSDLNALGRRRQRLAEVDALDDRHLLLRALDPPSPRVPRRVLLPLAEIAGHNRCTGGQPQEEEEEEEGERQQERRGEERPRPEPQPHLERERR